MPQADAYPSTIADPPLPAGRPRPGGRGEEGTAASRARRRHMVRSTQWSRAAEARMAAALALAAHELHAVAEAAVAREDGALGAELLALGRAVEQLDRDVLAAFCAAADRRLAAEDANPRLPLETDRW